MSSGGPEGSGPQYLTLLHRSFTLWRFSLDSLHRSSTARPRHSSWLVKGGDDPASPVVKSVRSYKKRPNVQMQEARWMGSRSGGISLYLSKQISNAAVVQHWARSVSGQTVAAGCSGTLIEPVSKEKPDKQNRFIETVSRALVCTCSWTGF